jgi:hypothetical protein
MCGRLRGLQASTVTPLAQLFVSMLIQLHETRKYTRPENNPKMNTGSAVQSHDRIGT